MADVEKPAKKKVQPVMRPGQGTFVDDKPRGFVDRVLDKVERRATRSERRRLRPPENIIGRRG